jgi:VanZ family protein
MVLLVRYLRGITFFRVSVRFLVILLLLMGMWIATRELDISSAHELNDKLIHLVVFFGFSILVDLSSTRKSFWLWKGFPLLSYGMVIEILQYFTPERDFSLVDWWADVIGVLLYFLLKKIIIKII